MHMLLFSLFPITSHWKDSLLGLLPKHGAYWPSISRTLLLPSFQSVAFYEFTFFLFLQMKTLYTEMCEHTHFPARVRIWQKKDYLALLVTSRDVSAVQLRECLHEWVIKCQAGLEE